MLVNGKKYAVIAVSVSTRSNFVKDYPFSEMEASKTEVHIVVSE